MDWFKLIKRYYDSGRYSKSDVAVFVVAGKITADEYESKITGDVYSP